MKRMNESQMKCWKVSEQQKKVSTFVADYSEQILGSRPATYSMKIIQ